MKTIEFRATERDKSSWETFRSYFLRELRELLFHATKVSYCNRVLVFRYEVADSNQKTLFTNKK